MDKYINKDLTKGVSSLRVCEGVSKDGVKYQYLDLVFTNGFNKRIFIDSREQFGIVNLIQSLEDVEPFEDIR